MENKFVFDREFQIGVLGLMVQNYDFLVVGTDLIKPEYFEDQTLVWYFQTIRDYFLDHHLRPTDTVLKNELLKAAKSGRVKDDDLASYLDVFKKIKEPVSESAYLTSEVVQFCRRQAVRRALLEVAPQLDSHDYDVWGSIENKVRDACNVGAHAMNIGTQYFLDYNERIRQRSEGEDRITIPTGITELDYRIGGGLKSGQLGVWMGGTGAGKSVVLPHCGKRAVVGGFKVVHYTLELNEQEVSDRYDSSWTGVPAQELVDNASTIKEQLDKLAKRFGNRLVVKFYPTRTATVATIKTHLRQLLNLGFKPDLVIVDYGDLLKPTSSYQDEYSDLGVIFADLRGLAGEMQVPIWTATQANRSGMAAETLDVEHVSDSLKKMQIADLVIAICMNREERATKQARLYLAKNRNGPAGVSIPIQTAYDRMAFYVPITPDPPIVTRQQFQASRRKPNNQ